MSFTRRYRKIEPTEKAVKLHAYVKEWYKKHGTGVSHNQAAWVLGVANRSIEHILVTCEASGLLMSEHDGKIYPMECE